MPRLTGRPYSEATAWKLIGELNHGILPLAWLDDNWHKLRRRARVIAGRALPELVDSLLQTPEPLTFALGGAFAAAHHGAATRPMTPPLDVYVTDTELERFAASIEFTEITATPNITIHAVSTDSWTGLDFGYGTTDLVTAWLDLSEAGDRASDEAWRALTNRAVQ